MASRNNAEKENPLHGRLVVYLSVSNKTKRKDNLLFQIRSERMDADHFTTTA